MRILELEIINFGKFNHETVTFHDGMNLIYGENEMGKTTLHSFIRGMFFGIEKQRGRAARKDEYQHQGTVVSCRTVCRYHAI